MAKENEALQPGREGVISIIGPGMRVVGDCESEGTLRIEGKVEGSVRAGKAVVVGKDGIVDGDIYTQDAVVGGHVTGSISAESRLELQATCSVEGEIRARRIKLEEGGKVNGNVSIGEGKVDMSGRRSAIHQSTPVTEEKQEKGETGPSNAAAGGT
ncbi:MAG: polymer-forming cytoskeletal protein [Gemmatimonadota bacterium]|jgi:cytoskeletal protein CcmA (bactofilin family)